MRIADPVPASPGLLPAPKNAAASLSAVGVCVSSMLGMAVAHADTAVPIDNDGDDDDKVVTINGVRSLLNDKLPESQLDTPQSLTVVTDKLMTEQGTTRLEEALKKVPGITLNAGEGAA